MLTTKLGNRVKYVTLITFGLFAFGCSSNDVSNEIVSTTEVKTTDGSELARYKAKTVDGSELLGYKVNLTNRTPEEEKQQIKRAYEQERLRCTEGGMVVCDPAKPIED